MTGVSLIKRPVFRLITWVILIFFTLSSTDAYAVAPAVIFFMNVMGGAAMATTASAYGYEVYQYTTKSSDARAMLGGQNEELAFRSGYLEHCIKKGGYSEQDFTNMRGQNAELRNRVASIDAYLKNPTPVRPTRTGVDGVDVPFSPNKAMEDRAALNAALQERTAAVKQMERNNYIMQQYPKDAPKLQSESGMRELMARKAEMDMNMSKNEALTDHLLGTLDKKVIVDSKQQVKDQVVSGATGAAWGKVAKYDVLRRGGDELLGEAAEAMHGQVFSSTQMAVFDVNDSLSMDFVGKAIDEEIDETQSSPLEGSVSLGRNLMPPPPDPKPIPDEYSRGELAGPITESPTGTSAHEPVTVTEAPEGPTDAQTGSIAGTVNDKPAPSESGTGGELAGPVSEKPTGASQHTPVTVTEAPEGPTEPQSGALAGSVDDKTGSAESGQGEVAGPVEGSRSYSSRHTRVKVKPQPEPPDAPPVEPSAIVEPPVEPVDIDTADEYEDDIESMEGEIEEGFQSVEGQDVLIDGIVPSSGDSLSCVVVPTLAEIQQEELRRQQQAQAAQAMIGAALAGLAAAAAAEYGSKSSGGGSCSGGSTCSDGH